MPYYCTVPRCTSMAGKAKNVSFHQFPRDEELAKLWNNILKRGKPYTKYSKVCSLHFRPEDYTITSVGKNRGQWRTLRKDAIPSQNLPLDIPAPYHRSSRNSGSWTPTMPQNMLDPQIHQQMAQAIYMQTMLAMQAQVGTDAVSSLHNGTQTPTDLTAHTSNDGPDPHTYKCTECSKCFKDPDVFKLHQRIHNKHSEKENVNGNNGSRQETLKSNPILANLLKNQGNIDANISILGIENQIMAALAANMENYIRNLMMNQSKDCSNQLQDSCSNQLQDSCSDQLQNSYEGQDSCDQLQDSCCNQLEDASERQSQVSCSNQLQNSCKGQDSCDQLQDSCSDQLEDASERQSQDSCDRQLEDSCRDKKNSCEQLQDSSDNRGSDSGRRDMDESADSNVLVIDENPNQES